MIGWIADGFRTIWALLAWNLRKTLFRRRGARGAAPCQHPSDSGRAGQTRCEACLGWSQPERFRRVCPLLQRTEAGLLRCTVDATAVRPFWGRAFGWYAGGAGALYLTLAFALFAAMRLIGYPVDFTTLAWPPAWDGIDRTRSAFFLQRAEDAYTTGRINEAMLSLTLAYEYDRNNYAAGALLARLSQASRPDVSDQLYGRLLAEHPEQRAGTAQLWLHALLPRGDFQGLEQLASAALQFDPEQAPAWLHALLFANGRTGNVALLDRMLASPDAAALPPGVRHVLALERDCRHLAPAAARDRLLATPPDTLPPYVTAYRARRLLALGFPVEALELAAGDAHRLPDRDRAALELEAYQRLGYRRLFLGTVERVFAAGLAPAAIELLCAQLLRAPDREVYDRLLRAAEAGATGDALPVQLVVTLFCVAARHGDLERQARLGGLLEARADARVAALPAAGAFFRGELPGGIEQVLPVLQPLGLDVNYALLALQPAAEGRLTLVP